MGLGALRRHYPYSTPEAPPQEPTQEPVAEAPQAPPLPEVEKKIVPKKKSE